MHIFNFLILGLVTTVQAQYALIIQQDGTLDNATFSLVDNDNHFKAVSDLSFAYQRPYIEATATNKSSFYVVAFPSADPNFASHLYELDGTDLSLIKQWIQPAGALSFFDLQYGANQDQLYGIAVNGTYGRVISKLDISGDEVTADYIAACPYMWYVNASTFDQANNIYFGLLNNFEDPTLGQKLIVVDVVRGYSNVYDYDSLNNPLLYYIEFTPYGLYAMGSDADTGSANLGIISYSQSSVEFKASSMFKPFYQGPYIGKFSPLYKSKKSNGFFGVCAALGFGDDSDVKQPDVYCENDQVSSWASPLNVGGQGNAQAAAEF